MIFSAEAEASWLTLSARPPPLEIEITSSRIQNRIGHAFSQLITIADTLRIAVSQAFSDRAEVAVAYSHDS